MLPDLLGAAVVMAVLAIPFASRRLRRSRDAGAAGGPPARPAARSAGRAAVPAVTVQPSGSPAEPFAYDGGVATGEDGTP